MGELQAGDVIDGKYRIVRLIGEGGMGAVYEGENVKIRRKVAIKTLLSGLTGNADVVGRFEREATAAGRIGNAHILEVLDLGEMQDGDRYMVMELLDGEPLSARIEARGHLSPAEVAPIGAQVLEGLAAAHAAGIIHRDLKPDNIFILKKHVGIVDYVKIIDFGVSKFQALSGDGEAMSMTRTGAVMGTPYYMSPEQASGSRDADHRTDLYALGVILYQAVSGRVPFDAPTLNQLLFKIVLSDPLPVKGVIPNLDDAFASIISKAMARDINARFQSADEFKAALDGWRTAGKSVSVPPPPDRASMEAAVLGTQTAKPDGSVPANTAMQPGAKTAGSWSTSQAGTGAKSSNKPIIAGLAIVGGLGVVGALAGYALFSGSESAPAEPSAAAAAVSPPPAAPAPQAPAAQPNVAPVVQPATAAPTPAPQAPAAESSAALGAGNKPASRAPATRRGAAARAPQPQRAATGAGAQPAPARPADDDFGY